MEFFDECPQSRKSHPLISRDSSLVASSRGQTLIVRESAGMTVHCTFKCNDEIQYIEWAPDSKFLLTANFERSLVEVWAVDDPEWTSRIDEAAAGLDAVRWAPDSRHILTTSEFQIRITVWSLINRHIHYLKFPKHGSQGLDFSRSGEYMAVLERHDFKDHIAVFLTDGWKIASHFPIDTVDAVDVKWSHDGRRLCVWDTSLVYGVCVYSLDGQLIGKFSAYQDALGIKLSFVILFLLFAAFGLYDLIYLFLISTCFETQTTSNLDSLPMLIVLSQPNGLLHHSYSQSALTISRCA
eukprot:m.87495 g.87495  ORF g.87495 m.87495 type:complete len:296 (-) comp12833_c0_seq2:899-1786(-)